MTLTFRFGIDKFQRFNHCLRLFSPDNSRCLSRHDALVYSGDRSATSELILRIPPVEITTFFPTDFLDHFSFLFISFPIQL